MDENNKLDFFYFFNDFIFLEILIFVFLEIEFIFVCEVIVKMSDYCTAGVCLSGRVVACVPWLTLCGWCGVSLCVMEGQQQYK